VRRGSFEVVKSFSGHLAVLDHDTREVMHPVVGPRAESAQLYVEPAQLVARLTAPPHDVPLVLLDVGLGAGSNAAAALSAARGVASPRRPLWVHSFDRTTDALALALAPAHAADFGFDPELAAAGAQLLEHGLAGRAEDRWRLSLGELPDALAAAVPDSAEVVFWDPFSPRQNPGLWGVSAFSRLRPLCRAGATVHTYSGATATRTALLLAGFAVGLGAPLGGKKRATVAALDAADLSEPLGPRFLARLTRSSAPLPHDAAPDALEQLASLVQLREPPGTLATR
jgi:queuine tRNA-ribosyltransferase